MIKIEKYKCLGKMIMDSEMTACNYNVYAYKMINPSGLLFAKKGWFVDVLRRYKKGHFIVYVVAHNSIQYVVPSECIKLYKK